MVKNEVLKEALNKELEVLRIERDKKVVDFKMIDRQHQHALKIFRQNFLNPKTQTPKKKVRVEFTSSSRRGQKEYEPQLISHNSIVIKKHESDNENDLEEEQ